MKNEKFLRHLLESISVSGYEESVQQAVEEEMGKKADEIWKDEMGNLISVLNVSSDRRIMLSAHGDEIGLMISNIREDGRLQVVRRGGIVPETYPGQQICIKSRNGQVYGVVEASRELFCKDKLQEKDFLIDIGAKDKKEAEELVSPGDPVVRDTHIRKMAGERFTARGLDDRLGVYIIMEAMKRAKELGCQAGVYGASTVGEETTKSGAYWASARIRPTEALVVDVTYTSDWSGGDASQTGTVLLGEGPVLCNSPIASKRMNAGLLACAKKAGIKVQWEAADSFSHTDGDKIHFSNGGVPVAFVSIPLRYMHMPAEVADWRDVEGCVELLARFLAE